MATNTHDPGTLAPSDSEDAAYLRGLLDATRTELETYKRGFVDEIRDPVLKELIGVAHTIEAFLAHDTSGLSADDFRGFLERGPLHDINQALSRYGVEPFICSTKTLNRSLQKVERVEETDDPRRDGQVRSLTRGYARGDRVLEQESVVAFRLRQGQERGDQ